MRSYSKTAPDLLRKRLDELEKELEAEAGDLLSEIRLVETLLRAAEEGAGKTYANIERPWDAIVRCLDINGDYKLTKEQAKAEILSNGYMIDRPRKDQDLLNDSFNYHLRKKVLDEKNGLIGRNPRVKRRKS